MATNDLEAAAPKDAPLGDEALLARYISDRDQAAFRELVERHAALVLSVCRRGAPSPADADDAFQATFIVLAKSAHKVKKPASLAAWLYGVAYRISVRSRRDAARRKAQPLMESMAKTCDPLDELLARHEQTITDEELAALPESLRTPFVLRYLAGHSNVEVAEKLGVSVSSIEGRLKRAKQRLRSRLIRRGVTLTMAVAVLKTTRVAAGEVPDSLLSATLETCFGVNVAATAAPAGGEPAAVQLAHQEVIAMKTLVLSKPLAAAIVAGCLTTLAVGVQYLPFADRAAGAAEQVALQMGRGAESSRADERRLSADLALAEFVEPTVPLAAETQVEILPAPWFDLKPRSEMEKQIAAALEKTINRWEFRDAPLEEVLESLRGQFGIQLAIDVSALEDQGIGADEPVTISLSNISFRSALRHLLRQHNLNYIVKDEIMLITTRVEAEEYLETRVYPIDENNVDLATLEEILFSHVNSDTWAKGGGGTAELTKFSGGLVITQTYEGHEEINELLKQFKWQMPKQ